MQLTLGNCLPFSKMGREDLLQHHVIERLIYDIRSKGSPSPALVKLSHSRHSALVCRERKGNIIIPTATLLEHTLLTQGFTSISKAAFPRRLRPQNHDSTWANLGSALK